MLDPDCVIEVRGLSKSFAGFMAVKAVDLKVKRGHIHAMIGPNGAGKTTTMRAIMGLLTSRSGSIKVNGVETVGLAPEQIAHLGIAYCPEERGIFPSLSVRENLMLPPVLQPGGLTTKEVLEFFPRLGERSHSPGTTLSGGEQQMLAIARILRTGCRVLLFDEPTEGLAPVIVQHIGRVFADLKQRGYTILLVEQNLDFVMELADHHYVIEHGHVVDQLTNDELCAQPDRLEAYLGV